MQLKSKLLIAAAGLAATTAFAAPAAAQSYPYNNGPYGYSYGQGGVLGAILNGILYGGRYQQPYGGYGYPQGQYGYVYMNEREAVDRCASAVNARLGNRGYNDRYGDRYGNYGYDRYGYGNGYNQARVTHIRRVDRKDYGLKVYGLADSGRYAQQYDRYGRPAYGSRADLKWECKIERNGRIRDIDVERR